MRRLVSGPVALLPGQRAPGFSVYSLPQLFRCLTVVSEALPPANLSNRAESNLRQYYSGFDNPITRAMLSVIVPVFNEVTTVIEVLEAVNATPFSKEIIVVDDGSNDGTTALLGQLHGRTGFANVTCLFSKVNSGKGAAIRKALPRVRGDFVVIQDADLEYSPADYAALLRPLLSGVADVVLGSRFHRGIDWQYPIHFLSNRILNLCFNLRTGKRLTDVETGMKAFRRENIVPLPLVEDHFGFEIEVLCRSIAAGHRVHEVPIQYQRRSYADGKKCTLKYQLAAVAQLMRYARPATVV